MEDKCDVCERPFEDVPSDRQPIGVDLCTVGGERLKGTHLDICKRCSESIVRMSLWVVE